MTFSIPCPSGSIVKRLLGTAHQSTGSFFWSDFPFGPEDPNRYIVVAAAVGGASSQPSTCLVDGVASSLVIGDGGVRRVRIFMINKPTGTIGTIQITGSGDGCAIIVWSLAPMFNPTVSATLIVNGGSIDTPPAGVTIAAAMSTNNGALSGSFTDIDNDASQVWSIGTNIGLLIGGSRTVASTGTITSDLPLFGGDIGFAAASFQFF